MSILIWWQYRLRFLFRLSCSHWIGSDGSGSGIGRKRNSSDPSDSDSVDSASDSPFWFTLDRYAPCASDSDSASDSVASVNQPLKNTFFDVYIVVKNNDAYSVSIRVQTTLNHIRFVNFTTVATSFAIWLTNLPLSIRILTTLLASMCHAMPFSVRALNKNIVFDVDIVVNLTNRMRFSVVCNLIVNDTCHHSGKNLLWTYSTAPRECTTFWPLWWRWTTVDLLNFNQ